MVRKTFLRLRLFTQWQPMGYPIILHLATACVVASGDIHLSTTFATRAAAVSAYRPQPTPSTTRRSKQPDNCHRQSDGDVCQETGSLSNIALRTLLLSADAELLNYPKLPRRIRDAPKSRNAGYR